MHFNPTTLYAIHQGRWVGGGGGGGHVSAQGIVIHACTKYNVAMGSAKTNLYIYMGGSLFAFTICIYIHAQDSVKRNIGGHTSV